MSDPKQVEPDEDLLEFLGGIDEANEEAQEEDFADFLARADIDRIAEPPAKPQTPPKDEKKSHE